MQAIEVACVVAFELVAGAGGVQRLPRVAAVLEAVAKYQIVTALEPFPFPGMIERLEGFPHPEKYEVSQTHLQAGNPRLPDLGRLPPKFDGHVGRFTRGYIQHAVGKQCHDLKEWTDN